MIAPRRNCICWAVLLAATASLAAGAADAAITYDLVTVGDSNNPNDSNGLGRVAYEYRIGKYDVTIGQYTAFLNAAARSDPYGLYDTNMGSDLNVAGIARTGSSGSYSYSVMNNGGSSANRPITYVSWFDAARFANWMSNGQGNGSTETGAYTIVGGQTSGAAPARNTGAAFALPTENEWYKAAYYQPNASGGPSDGYWAYATQTDNLANNIVGPNAANANWRRGYWYSVTQTSTYSQSQNYLTDVGAFSTSDSYYGTFDQSGNVNQWIDLNVWSSDISRRFRGGSWNPDQAYTLASSAVNTGYTESARPDVGFRLVSPIAVPEPSTYAMVTAAFAGGVWRALRRRGRRVR